MSTSPAHVGSGHWIYSESPQGPLQSSGNQKATHNPLPPTVQWLHRAHTSDYTENDREARPRETAEVAGSHQFYPDCLQHNKIPGDWVLTVLPYVWKAAPVTHRPLVPDKKCASALPHNRQICPDSL